MAAKTPKAFVATESFRTAGDKKFPRGRFVQKGDLFRSNDPLIKSHAAFFASADSVVERATAEPGEKRDVSVPTDDD